MASKNWQLSTDNCQLLGAVAQLGERLVCNQEATGSIPVSSTRKSRIDEAISALSGNHVCGLHAMGGLWISCSVCADSVVGSVEWNRTLRISDLCCVEDISATGAKYRLRKPQLYVGRQEKSLGVEHWVGGTWEFAHSWVSKTHTCIRGVANAS